MNIIRNIYCDGVFEGSYLLKYREPEYVWLIIETKEDYLRLNVAAGRDNYIYKNGDYHYGQIIPFREKDLCE